MYYGGSEPVACDPATIVIVGDSFTITLATGEKITTTDGKTWKSEASAPGEGGIVNEGTTGGESIVMTPEKWQDFLNINAIGWFDGVEYNMSESINKQSRIVPLEEVSSLPVGTPLVVFGADGVVTCGVDPAEAATLGEGGIVWEDITQQGLGDMPSNTCRTIYMAATEQYKAGERGVKISFGSTEAPGRFPIPRRFGFRSEGMILEQDPATGIWYSPILDFTGVKWAWLHKDGKYYLPTSSDPTSWINEMVEGGVDSIDIFLTQPPIPVN
jgi:hypothetical protein